MAARWALAGVVVVLACRGPGVATPRGGGAPQKLGVRNAHAMAYDAKRGVVVLFGGADARSVKGDTWIWDGATWTQASEHGPTPRTFPALAFDGGRAQVVLFGGRRVLFGTDADRRTVLADTWVWDGSAWRQVPVTGPPARAEAVSAYDPRRDRVVLFGGYTDEDGARQRLGDTWEWDGASWTRVASDGPAATNGAALAFDAARGKIVLFGGGRPAGGPSPDTWEWDGRDWERVTSAVAPGRYNSAAVSDPAGGVIRFGGWDGTRRVAETWAYRDGGWSLLSTAGPSARNHAALAADPRRGRIVLFGGHDGDRVFGDTWEWDGSRWSPRSDQAAEARVDNGH